MVEEESVNRIKLLVLATASVVASGLVTSAMAAMPLPIGWYVEGQGGYTKVSGASYGSSGLGTSSPGFGWNLDFGYKFMPYFAGEVGYNSYAKAKIKYNGTQVAQDVHNSYYIAGKGILPISDSGFELFAKLGVAHMRGHVTITNPSYANANGVNINAGTHSATGAYFGGGGSYNFMPNFSMNLQWARSKGNSSIGNLDLYTLGFNYLFN